MNRYTFHLHSGQSFHAEDARDLDKLSADLCSAGFLVVVRHGAGYSATKTKVSVLERAVAMIEPES